MDTNSVQAFHLLAESGRGSARVTDPSNMPLLIVSLVLNGAGQGTVIPLALYTILNSVDETQAGMGSGAVSTMQLVGTSVGVTIVGILFFSLIGSASGDVTPIRDTVYGHAFSVATIYNLAATFVSFLMFSILARKART